MARALPDWTIPAYALYGEADAARYLDGVHAETIPARSAGLDWRIEPHRHGGLHQAILVARGGAEARIEDAVHRLEAGSLAWIPPLIVHGYRFAPGTSGIVVSLPRPVLSQALFGALELEAELAAPILVAAGHGPAPRFGEAARLFEAILDDFAASRPGRDASLTALAGLLAIWFAREALRGRDEVRQASRPGLAVVKAYLEAVEASYAARRPLPRYAEDLGLSMSHLNRICRDATGRSPLRILHDRRMLEAKRSLVHTALPVAAVAQRLGFEDAAYFSRFFRERAGCSPAEFRAGAARATGET